MSPISNAREITLSHANKPIRIRTNKYGTLQLRELSYSDAEFLGNLLKTDLPARDFTAQFVHHQVVEPALSMEEIQGWANKLLLRVGSLWAKHQSDLDQDFLKENISSFDTFKHVLAEYIAEQHRKIQDMMGGFSAYIAGITSSLSSVLPSTTLQSITDDFLQMTALNVKLAGLEALPKVTFVNDQVKSLYQSMGQLVGRPLQTQLAQLSQIRLPEPFLSDTMYISGLNSPLLHTPAYTYPRVEPVHRKEDIPRRAEEAAQHRLVSAYDTLSQLELSLRNLVEIKLHEIYGGQWWKCGVPENVRKECEERKKREEKSLEVSHHPIHYSYLGHCKDIIMRGDNWKASFSTVFAKKTEFEVFFDRIQKVRPSIGHPRPISDDDYLLFTASARWIQIAINRAISNGLQ